MIRAHGRNSSVLMGSVDGSVMLPAAAGSGSWLSIEKGELGADAHHSGGVETMAFLEGGHSVMVGLTIKLEDLF